MPVWCPMLPYLLGCLIHYIRASVSVRRCGQCFGDGAQRLVAVFVGPHGSDSLAADAVVDFTFVRCGAAPRQHAVATVAAVQIQAKQNALRRQRRSEKQRLLNKSRKSAIATRMKKVRVSVSFIVRKLGNSMSKILSCEKGCDVNPILCFGETERVADVKYI